MRLLILPMLFVASICLVPSSHGLSLQPKPHKSTKALLPNFQPSSVVPSVAIAFAAFLFATSPVLADEYGVEKEAPTLFTGETVLKCVKRGPLGACLQTETRTAENDNDKSLKYFQDPTEASKRKEAEMRSTAQPEEGNLLIEKLRRQTEENKEKNELIVKQKTLLNDQSASFGPFDRQVVILNEDGKGFTLLENPQAMRLKKDGFIKDRQFIKQPTKEELDQALVPEGPSLGDAIQGFFGGGGGD
ncbi:vac14 homolog (Saccharomyces cerevisiae) [Seminavis robusta]|uniref:Vac14 homolog (Saccharomyces cerevisiae) n=1 Tax=Seminavis robusta TaxID=568900 RepID=A0A9N8H6L9_9STRA|nr:vac14 homolog (Saccharomyces cerevisiae) [Seminavis robusta]|eukprot:Sro151_g069150.1 vac14 homolog (Saccharomyces cerevisiae) (246) ;mRNA; f:45561-46514